MKHTRADILVVEDDAAILQGLLDVLVFNGYHAEGTPDGRRGLDSALSTPYDLLILDVMLPGINGFDICRRVRRHKPNQAIVMLTARGAEDDIVEGFRAGADDYISKPFSLRELMVRLEAVLRRTGKHSDDACIELQGIRFDGNTLTAHCCNASTIQTFAHTKGRPVDITADQSVELTRREMDIMLYLHRHQDRIVSRKELLLEVWHYADADIETRTVDIHMLKLRKKIAGLNPDLQLIRTVRGQGYRLPGT